MSDWGKGAKNNDIGWGQGAVNNDISWGAVHANSWAGDTEIVGFAYDSTYQSVLDYGTSLGYTLPSDSQKLLQNQLLIDLKTAGVWDKLDTFANFATDGSSNFALIDWKRLTQYTAVNSPTFTTNQGFQGNGTSSYINTNFNPATSGSNYKLNDASRCVYVNVAPTINTGTTLPIIDGTINGFINTLRYADTDAQRINQNLLTTGSTVDMIGLNFKSINRDSSSTIKLFNNLTQNNRTVASTSIENSNQLLFRTSTAYSNIGISMYAMGASLVTENTSFVNAFNTYINSL